MRGKKNILIIILVIILLGNCLCGCKEKDRKKEITIYSLYENEEIRKGILLYKDKNKDMDIKYEVGIEDKSGITKDDAVKTLNSELLSGKGPDIIFLDNLTQDYYIEKEIISDISDIVDNNKDKILSNVINKSTKDKKIYTLPLRIRIPKVVGKSLDGIDDLESLTKSIESDTSNSKLLDVYSPEELISLLYYSSINSWISKDDKLIIDNIKEFLVSCKKIYTANNSRITEADRMNHESVVQYHEDYIGSDGVKEQWYLNRGDLEASVLFSDSPKYDIGNIENIVQLYMVSAYENMQSPVYNNNWKGQIGNYYLPSMIVSISSKSEHKKEAEKYIEYLLNNSKDDTSIKSGFTVNKEVLKEQLIEKNEMSGLNTIGNTKENVEVDVPRLTDDEINNIINSIEKLNVQANTDTTFLNLVKDDMVSYILGENDIDKTLKLIENKTKLLLSE